MIILAHKAHKPLFPAPHPGLSSTALKPITIVILIHRAAYIPQSVGFRA